MAQEQFIDAVMEQIFVRGYICPARSVVAVCVQTDRQRLGTLPDPADYAGKVVQFLGLRIQPDGEMGTPSPSAGARYEWLAVHEAGHAIVGVKAGLTLWGVRFYNDGFPGQAFFYDPDWKESRDEHLLRRLIRVDVASNVAELLHPACGDREGRLSAFYDDRSSGQRPTDFIDADKKARRLAIVRFEAVGKEPGTDEVWRARREILEQAEAEAEQVLRENMGTLMTLAQELRRGPMTGATVRAIVGE